MCTRNGLKVEILRFEVKNPHYQIAALITDENGVEYYQNYTKYGKYYDSKMKDHRDLVMAPIKHKGWINIYPSNNKFTMEYETGSNIFSTKGAAVLAAGPHCIATIPIEWEE